MSKKIYSLLITSILLVSTLSANVGLSGGFYVNDKLSSFDTDGIGLDLSVDYNQKLSQNVDISYGLSYGSQKIKGISGIFHYFVLKINGEYNINSQFYTFAGLNLPYALAELRTITGTVLTKYTGEIGFQLGAGYNINEKLAIELGYKVINAKAKSTKSTFIESGSTEIAEAITLNTKYTF